MNQAIAGNESPISHGDLSPQERPVGQDNAVSQPAVVSNMGVGHEKIARTEHGVLLRFVRSVHCHMFAKDVLIANPQPGWLVFILQILRRFTDDAPGEKLVLRADARKTRQIDMGADDAIRTQFNPFINDGVRSNLDIGWNSGFRMNNGSWMNHNLKSGARVPVAKSKLSIAHYLIKSHARSLSGIEIAQLAQ